MLQLALTILMYLIIVIPVGRYLYHIAAGKHTFADPVFDRIDGVIYKIGGVDPAQGMNWKQYALALSGTNAVMVAMGYLVLRIQSIPLFNPNGIGAMEPTLSFNTIISFMTNTNLQHYSGESGLSYLSQMLVIIFMMFVSAASGYAACVAFIRGLAGKSRDNVGNFFADLIRITTRILLPFSVAGGLLLVWQGVPQNFEGNVVVKTLEGTFQTIAMGPIAALEIIKHLGTNGGGFLGANSATPLENPTMLSDLIELYAMMLLPGACVITFGKMVGDSRRERLQNTAPDHALPDHRQEGFTAKIFGREGRSVFAAMGILFLVGLSLCCWAELQGNPALAKIGLDQSMGSMEGKEVRFGIAQSALFIVACLGELDLDHLGAHIRQHHGAVRSGQHTGQIQYYQIFQSPVLDHGFVSSRSIFIRMKADPMDLPRESSRREWVAPPPRACFITKFMPQRVSTS